jgi:hypothetical protein
VGRERELERDGGEREGIREGIENGRWDTYLEARTHPLFPLDEIK